MFLQPLGLNDETVWTATFSFLEHFFRIWYRLYFLAWERFYLPEQGIFWISVWTEGGNECLCLNTWTPWIEPHERGRRATWKWSTFYLCTWRSSKETGVKWPSCRICRLKSLNSCQYFVIRNFVSMKVNQSSVYWFSSLCLVFNCIRAFLHGFIKCKSPTNA